MISLRKQLLIIEFSSSNISYYVLSSERKSWKILKASSIKIFGTPVFQGMIHNVSAVQKSISKIIEKEELKKPHLIFFLPELQRPSNFSTLQAALCTVETSAKLLYIVQASIQDLIKNNCISKEIVKNLKHKDLLKPLKKYNPSPPWRWVAMSFACIASMIMTLQTITFKQQQKLKESILNLENSKSKRRKAETRKKQIQKKQQASKIYEEVLAKAQDIIDAPLIHYELLKTLEEIIPDDTFLEEVDLNLANGSNAPIEDPLLIQGVSHNPNSIIQFFMELEKKAYIAKLAIDEIAQDYPNEYAFSFHGDISTRHKDYL